MHAVKVYIALGSNLGNREENLKQALDMIRKMPGATVRRASSFYATAPVGGPPQDDFLNAAAELEVTLSPRELLEGLQAVENSLGRVRTVRWGPRTIDLDIILYNEEVVDEPDLKIPHPLMHERKFVLEPLAEIAPDARHPLFDKTVRQLLNELQ